MGQLNGSIGKRGCESWRDAELGRQLLDAQQYARQTTRRVLGGSVEDTEDALQTAALKAMVAVRAGRFRGDCAFRTWFVTIARNEAKVTLRRASGQGRAREFVQLDEHERVSGQIRADTADAFELVVAREVQERVRAAIRQLAPRMQREAWAWLAEERLRDDTRRKSNRHHAKVRLREALGGRE